MKENGKTESPANGAQEQSADAEVPHRIHPRDMPGREIVITGFFLADPASGGAIRLSRSGHHTLGPSHETARRSLLSIILESARFVKAPLPDLFTPDSAELFYRDARLEEVRLRGRTIAGFDCWQNPVYQETSTNREPRLSRESGRIMVSVPDAGRNYVAVLIEKESLVVTWNMAVLEQRDWVPEVVYAKLWLTPDEESVDDLLDEELLTRTEEELREVPVGDLAKALLLPKPSEIRNPVLFEVSEPFRKLTYVYERDDARRQLSENFAESADLSERSIRKLASEQFISFERAKALRVHEFRQLRDEFIEQNMDKFFDSTAKVLRDVFTVSLTHQVNNIVLADGAVPGMDLSRTPVEAREQLLKNERDMTRRRFGMAGRGRTPGTHPKRSSLKSDARRALNKSRVEGAISELLLPAGKMKLGAAMLQLTPEKVCEKLGIKISTLRRWVNQSWPSFDEAKTRIGMSLFD